MNRRLKASSLTEVLIALAIASIVFVIGTMVFLGINRQNNPGRKAEYRWMARTLLNEAIATGNTRDETVEQLGVKFTRQMKPLNAENGLYEAHLLCIGADESTLLDRTLIVHIPPPPKPDDL